MTGEPGLLGRAIQSAVINDGGYRLLNEPAATAAVGGTHLYDAIYLASTELMKSREGRKVLIVLTDGEDQGSREDFAGALEAAEKADVIVYTVALVDRSFYWLHDIQYRGNAALKNLSVETGGRIIPVKALPDTGAAFREIADELRAQYSLGYSPSNKLHDGSFRHIQLHARVPHCKVRVRRGYFAADSEGRLP